MNGKCYIMPDNKIGLPTRLAYSTPWLHVKPYHDGKNNCSRYQQIYNECFKFIHSNCLNCWKVVLRPRNLVELFEVRRYQKNLRRSSKCGTELRAFVPAKYGAYFYNDSMEEGLDILETVRKDFPKCGAILKRGCTEFELAYGPSNKWGQTSRDQKLEEILDATLLDIDWNGNPYKKKPLPRYVEENTKRQWVEFAFDRGDSTYKQYTMGHPIVTSVLTYEKELQNGCQVDSLIEVVKK